MHLELRLPNNWYEAHLVCGDFDVAGRDTAGHALRDRGAQPPHVAWGFTNVGPAVEDVFIEKFNEKGEYLTPQGWVQPEHRQEIIRVKGKPEVKFDVVVTRHGPIITSLVPGETAPVGAAMDRLQAWLVEDSLLPGQLGEELG